MEANNGRLVPPGGQHQWWDWTRALFIVTYFCWHAGLQLWGGAPFNLAKMMFRKHTGSSQLTVTTGTYLGLHQCHPPIWPSKCTNDFLSSHRHAGMDTLPRRCIVAGPLHWRYYNHMGPAKSDECTRNKQIILSVGELLGHKCVGPTSCLVCLGTESEAMKLKLPHANLVNLHNLIKEWLGCKACTRHQIESLICHLNHNHACIRWSIPV